MKFDLWDVETNKYLGHYEDEAEALVLVRTLVSNYGPAFADDLELGGITDEGETLESLSGAALIARADEVLSARQNDQGQRGVVIGFKALPRGAKGEESIVAAGALGRRRVDASPNRKRQKQ
jgi:hypothetical protein